MITHLVDFTVALMDEALRANCLSILLAIASSVILVKSWSCLQKPHGRYPPGPQPKLIIDNLFDIPKDHAARKYLEMGKKYRSDIIHLSAFGQHIIVLNKLALAEELLERRAHIYSGRLEAPPMKLMGWDHNFALLDYGPAWQRHRRVAQQYFTREASKRFEPVQLYRVRKVLLHGLLHFPEKFDILNKLLSVSIPLDMMYGYDASSLDDPVVVAATKSFNIGGPLMSSSGSMMNIFPLLRHVPSWFPGATSQSKSAEVARLTREVKRIPMEDLKRRMASGNASPSLVYDFLENKITTGASEEDEKIINNIAYTVYGGAADTTISATASFFYLMAANPDVQKRAQVEIDRVIGAENRLPDFRDRPALPYVEAVYRELLRYQPPDGLGISHLLSEDDYFKGYFIPKGSLVFGNIWAMTHDPEVYKSPHEFQPKRFLDENGTLNGDERVLAYGFGRRVCVGQHVASSTTWMTIVSVLAAFKIERARDELGNEIPLDDEFADDGIVWYR
ncbi:unnamed protein product [Cyclocybe aegerita]|uniref:Cytochrome P450 n=1 Tax=Cyclocybe aegerita TaxID=1973307 RepID=A0A8S0XKI5_CYCAE|nr:unnamed protein product [Cyclocybe aegerita]